MKAARYFEGVSYKERITRPFVEGKGREEYNNGRGGKGEEITNKRERRWEEKQLSNMGGGGGGGQKKLLTDVVGGGTTPRN